MKIKLEDVIETNSQIISMQKVFKEKYKRYLKKIKETHKMLYFIGVLETVIIIIVGVIQLFLIKNLISEKRLF